MDNILLSWIARNNDPYSRTRKMTYMRDARGNLYEGPTLSLMFSPDSPYRGSFKQVYIFTQKRNTKKQHKNSLTNEQIAQELKSEIHKRAPEVVVHFCRWDYDNPTDHKAIFEFMRHHIPQIRKQHPQANLVINASTGTPSMHTIWVLMAEAGFIQRPFEIIQSHRVQKKITVKPISIGLETFYNVYEKNRRHRPSAQQGIFWDPDKFVSTKLIECYHEARRFARLNVPILIMGERGTGKTTLASWVRFHSPFRDRKKDTDWPSVACGMYSPETMRAELFGYKRGAFTGADKDHPGLLAYADKDTLFLDEISDLPHNLQRLLIRAIEEKTFPPLGATQPSTSHFRLITASNRPWHELEQQLSPDFLDRIGMLTIKLPSLREIPEDIPWLWEQVYEQALIRSGLPHSPTFPDGFHTQLIEQLQRQTLPGNIRDLLRIAYKLLAFAHDQEGDFDVEEVMTYILRHSPQQIASTRTTEQVHQAVCLSFATGQGIPPRWMQKEQPLSTKDLFRALKGYIAEEIREQAKTQRISAAKLCDVTERSLLSWSSHGEDNT
ncbi:MAG TPA: hypothetical protein DCE42_00910 [Myxococcales bacterium]|nr:hypothetical protein [Myxococcales bacterium]